LKKTETHSQTEGTIIIVKTQIVNVVATASLDQELDFEELRKYKEIFHDSDVYGGRVAYFKTETMQGKVSIFNSGKMISIGTTSEEKAFKELELAARFIIKKGYAKPVELKPQTRNIVVTGDFETNANLEKLSETARAIYEPEQFPAAILRIEKPFRTSVLIFSSGRTVITGLTSSTQIPPIIQHLAQLLKSNL